MVAGPGDVCTGRAPDVDGACHGRQGVAQEEEELLRGRPKRTGAKIIDAGVLYLGIDYIVPECTLTVYYSLLFQCPCLHD